MTRAQYVRQSERGAILVHVAAALMMLIALSAFAVDFGLFWLGRGQAQNSADAAAIAGAIGLAYDSSTDTSDTGPAKLSALMAARANLVAGQQPSVSVTDDITFVDCPDGTKAPACIRVNVYRDNAHGQSASHVVREPRRRDIAGHESDGDGRSRRRECHKLSASVADSGQMA